MRPLVSIVTPCYNEAENVPEHLRRVRAALAPFAADYTFEHIYTDNDSEDITWQVLTTLGATDPSVKALRFSRNIGANRAMAMGLAAARGEAVILIQADLQDPPELIAEFLKGWKEGFDVVYGRITNRDEGPVLRILRKLYYRMAAGLADSPLHKDAGEFRLTSRRALDAMLRCAEDDVYLRGVAAAVGYRQKAIPYARAARSAGKSSNSLLGLVRYALNGIVSTTTGPIRFVTVVGLALSVLGLLLTAGLVFVKVFLPVEAPRGITLLATLITFFSGAQLFAIGIIGEYIRKIYIQSLGMPRGFIQDRINL
jgi:dolichol-phosphate mannosyltransferase